MLMAWFTITGSNKVRDGAAPAAYRSAARPRVAHLTPSLTPLTPRARIELPGMIIGDAGRVNHQVMPRDTSFRRAIARAEKVLLGGRGTAASHRRWKAVAQVGEFVRDYPEEVCEFALRWAKHPGIDLGRAVSCCL